MSTPLKPVNLGTNGCKPISSSCVFWQGDDINCIEVCDGATLDDIIHQIGCLACNIDDQLNVDTYSLECFNLNDCDIPHTFREFMQYLIDLICQLNDTVLSGGVTPVEGGTGSSNVTVASCFQAGGITQTVEQYIQAIGQLVCDQQVTINNQQAAIQQLNDRVTALEQ